MTAAPAELISECVASLNAAAVRLWAVSDKMVSPHEYVFEVRSVAADIRATAERLARAFPQIGYNSK